MSDTDHTEGVNYRENQAEVIYSKKTKLKFSNVETKIPKEFHKQIELIDKIFAVNEETIDSIYDDIGDSGEDMDFIYGVVEFAMKIRPKQRESIFTLLSRLIKKYPYFVKKTCSEEIRKMLVCKELIPNNCSVVVDKSFDEMIHIFPEGSIERVIEEDDLETFIKYTNDPGFDPDHSINVEETVIKFVFDYHESCIPMKDRDFVDPFSKYYATYPKLSAYFGSIKCFKYMMMNESFDLKGATKYAIAGGNKEIVKLLEQKGYNFNDCYKIAVKFNRHELCSYVLDNYKHFIIGMSVSQKWYNYRAYFFMELNNNPVRDGKSSALINAAGTGNLLMVKHTLKKGAGLNSSDDIERLTALGFAAFNNHFPVFEFLVAKKANANIFTSIEYYSPAFLAAWNGNYEMVKTLIEKCKCDTHCNDNKGHTLLHMAAKGGNVELVQYLIKAGFSADQEDDKGKLPLHMAARHGKLEVVKYFIEKCKIKASQKDRNGATPMHYAARNNQHEIVHYLAEKRKLKAIAKDEEGRTPLHYAAMGGDAELVKYMVKNCNAKVNTADKEKVTPVLLAAECGNTSAIRGLLLECGANPDLTYRPYKSTLLQKAAEKGNAEVVKCLVESKCDVNARDVLGRTALYLASKEGFLNVVKILVEKGSADLEIGENGSRTPLYIAANYEHFPIVKYLVEKGANVNAKDYENATPKRIAKKFHNKLIADYIAEHGGV